MAELTFNSDLAQSALVGLAIGDLNRGPTEMVLLTAESLLSRGRFDAGDISARWLNWWRQGAWDTGQVFGLAMQYLDAGADVGSAAYKADQVLLGMTAGCNAAHRAPVLAAFGALDNEELDDCARVLAGLTHAHMLAQDSAVFVTRLCRLLIQEVSWSDAVSGASAGLSKQIYTAVLDAMDEPGGAGGYSPDVLQSALFFLGRNGDFNTALSQALTYAGPANYCPVLVGAIGGARWGLSSSKISRLTKSRKLSRLISASTRLTTHQGGAI